MSVLTAEKKIMSNVSGKLYDKQRIVDTLYLDPVLKDFVSGYSKSNELSLTFILSRIIEFCVMNKAKIKVDRRQLKEKSSRKGIKTTVRVKQDVYSKFTEYVIDEVETSRSAYLNMILTKMYENQNQDAEFSTHYLEQILIS